MMFQVFKPWHSYCTYSHTTMLYILDLEQGKYRMMCIIPETEK